MEDVILIKAQSKTGGLFTMLVGGLIVVLGSIILLWLPDILRLGGIFILSGGIVAMLIGWFKLREPEHSMHLSKTAINYHHRHGGWLLNWNNIARIDTPKVYRNMQHEPLAMVGIRIKDYDEFLGSISPRLMNNILVEQRALLVQTFKEQYKAGDASLDQYSDYLIEDTAFTSEKGRKYTGLQAMFANRMQRLREGLGYDIYISVTELDRSADAFVGLLKQCHSSSNS
ncbi:DUF2982 domain-containing protein [Alteromonas sp. a30]|uniref:DUF2982 domain-containing protein n=1 Tax=Alteromonas sp. a30 TaxID=2730917 RepID=UPI002280F7C9|nr:DUF2982 domain-containing protein [Alteromonas sp. a30]MCY7295325.1 DUF2982 domain-containing protein [Alteromonas sp. a30]